MNSLVVAEEDPQAADVQALIAAHLVFAHTHSPPEDVFAIGADALAAADVTLFGARLDGRLLGIGAIRDITPDHAELKSMHTAADVRGCGVGRTMLDHLLRVAHERGCTRVSLETGAMAAFAPARAMYASAGFVVCRPFGDYREGPNSVCMTLDI